MPRPPRTLVLNYLLKKALVATTDEAMHVSDEIVTLLEEAGHLQSTATRTASGGGLLSSEPRGEDVQGSTGHRALLDSQRVLPERREDGGRRDQQGSTMVRSSL